MVEQALELVRELALPIVEAGHARLDWTDPKPDDDWFAYGEVALVPTATAAAGVVVSPHTHLVTLLVGPRGNSHELVVDRKGLWLGELRACLQAVIAGRYRESAAPGKVSRQVVTMTFEVPDGNDIVVKHHELFELDTGEQEAPRERRFSAYA